MYTPISPEQRAREQKEDEARLKRYDEENKGKWLIDELVEKGLTNPEKLVNRLRKSLSDKEINDAFEKIIGDPEDPDCGNLALGSIKIKGGKVVVSLTILHSCPSSDGW